MKLSRSLKAERKVRGALELASNEIGFEMDKYTGERARANSRTLAASGAPTQVREKAHLDTMSMVEEFMLLANISVAERILKAFPDCALLRRHPTPDRESFKPLLAVRPIVRRATKRHAPRFPGCNRARCLPASPCVL